MTSLYQSMWPKQTMKPNHDSAAIVVAFTRMAKTVCGRKSRGGGP